MKERTGYEMKRNMGFNFRKVFLFFQIELYYDTHSVNTMSAFLFLN